MRGHYDSELWGLAVHPRQNEMITVGRDALLAVWDMKAKQQKRNLKLDGPADAIAMNHAATHVAIGYTNGTFQVLEYGDFVQIKRRNDRKGKAIQVIKYTPNDEVVAVGGHDSLIMTYNAANGYKPMKKIRSHHSTINHIDFSLDSLAMMSNCSSYEILFHEVQTGT